MIKYRAWDNADNKMYFTGEEEDIHFYFDSSGIVAEKLDGGAEKLEHLVYMQFTGLKDSAPEEEHPMEIYEGDIMFHPVSGEYFIVTRDDHYANFFLKNSDENKEDYDFVEMDGENIFVVGNVYQNLEILKGE